MQNCPEPVPGKRVTFVLFAALLAQMVAALVVLLSVDDPVRLKELIEDSGPVQAVGQYAIAAAFLIGLLFSATDRLRRRSYLYLSYLLMFYALREADYHYKLSEYAKATQFKRFFSHEMIPLSSKLFLFSIVVLFLIVFVTYLKDHHHTFLRALRCRLPWSLMAGAWALVFFLSQAVDQIPWFHNVTGQVFEEVLESSAEVLALLAMILFRLQLRGGDRSGAISGADSPG
jgi:hypothetical protein